jgi:hypothetical protein
MSAKKKKPARGGKRPGAGRKPSPTGPGTKAFTTLPPALASWLAEPYAGDVPQALRETAQLHCAQAHAAYPRIRAALTDADLHACLDAANGLLLTTGLLGQHLAADLQDHGDPAYAETAERVAGLDDLARVHLELWARAWWAADDDRQAGVMARVTAAFRAE